MGAVLTLIMSLCGVKEGLAKIIAAGVAIIAATGAVWGGYELIKHIGAEEVRQEIKDQTNEAGIKGSEARMSRADCNARDGIRLPASNLYRSCV